MTVQPRGRSIGAGNRQVSVRAAQPLVDIISDPGARELCLRLVDDLAALHGEVSVTAGGVDIRADFGGRPLCRLVPYRELVHVQVGDAPMWESRVRDETGYYEAIDMILKTFLRWIAARTTGRYPLS